MFIPFLDKIGIGLAFDTSGLHYISLKKRWNRTFLQSHQFYPLETDLKHTLSNIPNKEIAKFPFVVVNLPDFMSLFKRIDLAQNDQEGINDLIAEEENIWQEELGTDWTIKSVLISGEADESCLLLGALPTEALTKHLELLKSKGFVPLICAAGSANTWMALWNDVEAFVQHEAIYIHDNEQLKAWFYKDKYLIGCQELPVENQEVLEAEVQYLMQAHFGNETDKVGYQVTSFPSVKGLQHFPVLQALHLKKTLSSGYAIAAGLAMQALFETPKGLNFLAVEAIEDARLALDKFHSIRYILGIGGLLFALLLGSFVGIWILNQRLQSQEMDFLLAKKTQDKALIAGKKVDMGYKAINQQIRYLNGRLNGAPIMYKIGKQVPSGVWFSQFLLNDAGTLLIEGYAENESNFSNWIPQIEHFFKVESVETKRLDATAALSQTKVNKRPLLFFSLSLKTK